jgi:uncharacterized repeat protein (TIGR03803 family)
MAAASGILWSHPMKMIWFIGLALIGAQAATSHAQTYKVLVNLNNVNDSFIDAFYFGSIAQSRGGYMICTVPSNSVSDGVAMRISTSGVQTILHEFDNVGGYPTSGVMLGRNGEFFGTTLWSSTNLGSIFEMTPDGTVKVLHELISGPDRYPNAPLIQSLYGDFYGTTTGDATHSGSVYKINEYGGFTHLHTFTGSDGANPYGPLVQATNFWFYGTTGSGGANNSGTIFRINSSGEFEVLYNFDGTHGTLPIAGLIQANDGNFYGTAYYGGAYNAGVVFKMTPAHHVTVLHDFNGGSDGSGPEGELIQATDGYLYGITSGGGASGGGVLFRISTTGVFTVLHPFHVSDGANPLALIQHTDGFLYGDTVTGGYNSQGVFYRFDIGQAPFVTYLSSYGRAGMTVQILGQYFTADSEVFFNGVAAQVTEVEPTYMRVVVPDGATSGFITVTTAKGTLKSDKVFLVRP